MCICINMYLNIYIYIYIFIYMCSSEWTSRCRPCRPTRWCTRHAPPHPQNALFVSRALGFALSLAHRYPPPPARHPPPARLTATCRPCLLMRWCTRRARARGNALPRGVLPFRGGLVFKAHRLLCHSTLGVRVIQKPSPGVKAGDLPRLTTMSRGS